MQQLFVLFLCSLAIAFVPTSFLSAKSEVPVYSTLDWVLLDVDETRALSEWRFGDTRRFGSQKRQGNWIPVAGDIAMGWRWIGIQGRNVVYRDEFGELISTNIKKGKSSDVNSVVTNSKGQVIALNSPSQFEFDMRYIEQFSALKYIDLTRGIDGPELDFATFSLPKSIEVIRIGSSRVKNIDILSNLPNLQGVAISNSIVKLKDISKIKHLSYLSIDSYINYLDRSAPNYLRSLHDIKESNELIDHLYITNTLILNGIYFSQDSLNNFAKRNSSIENFSINLGYSGHKFEGTSYLRHLINLKYLSIGSTDINKIMDIPSLKKLETLIIRNNYLSNLEGIDRYPQLAVLDLHSNLIRDLSPLKALLGLNWIDLSQNHIEELDSFEPLTQLTHLDLNSNYYRSSIGLKNLHNLTSLILGSPYQNTLDGLFNLDKLETLEVYQGEYRNMEGLPPNLKTLHIDNGGIDYRPGKTVTPYDGPIDASALLQLSSLRSVTCGSCLSEPQNSDIDKQLAKITLPNALQDKRLEKQMESNQQKQRLEILKALKKDWIKSRKTND